MNREELIEREADLYHDLHKHSSANGNISRKTIRLKSFKDGINSPLNSKLTELAVVEGKIEVLYLMAQSEDWDYLMSQAINDSRLELIMTEIKQLQIIRSQIINELNKGI